MKNPKNRRQVPLEEVMNITKTYSPDDVEVGKMGDLQQMVEQKDDLSPDDFGPKGQIGKGNRNGR